MTEERFAVQHRAEESRYVLIDRGEDGAGSRVIGEESYVDTGDGGARERVLFHTFVSDEYSGQGLASQLVQEVVEHAVAEGYGIVPVCPYVAAWLRKHPEYAAHAVTPGPEHRRAIPTQEG